MDYETWVEPRAEGRGRVRLTPDFCRVAGAMTFLELRPVGSVISAGGPVGLAQFDDLGECELTCPAGGRIVAINPEAQREPPRRVNEDPQGEGWLLELDTGEAG